MAKDLIGYGWLPALFAALAATSAIAETRDVEIHFQNRTAVNGERVVLGDVATIYAKSLKNFDKISNLIIGHMPSESDLAVPAEYVRIRVEEALGGSKLSVRVNAPDKIEFYKMKIESAVERLGQEILRQAREMKKIPEGVEIVPEISTKTDLQKLNFDDYTLTPAATDKEWRGHVVFRLLPKSGNGEGHWVNARIRWYINAWIAKNSIPYFKDITADQFETAKIEVTQMRELPVTAGNAEELARLVKETRAKRSFRPGTALAASMLDRKPDIKSGQRLKIVFIAESGVRVAADGMMIGDGIVGDSVKARLKTSKKIVAGKLISPEILEVSL